MRKYYERANTEIIKAIAHNEKIYFAKSDKYFIVTVSPCFCAYVLPEDWVLFNLDKAMRHKKLEEVFSGLMAQTTINTGNEILPTDMYISGNGKQFTRQYTGANRLTGEKHKVWLNAAYTKDVESLYCNFYQEEPESFSKRHDGVIPAETKREFLPVLAAKVDPVNGVDFVPLKIILPVRISDDERNENE